MRAGLECTGEAALRFPRACREGGQPAVSAGEEGDDAIGFTEVEGRKHERFV